MLPKINNIKSKSDIQHSKYIYTLNFDGCSKGNPGLSGAGAVIYYLGNEIWSDFIFVGEKNTNNYAEYSGLILGLEQAISLKIRNIQVIGDSLLVINHMNGIYQCKSSNLMELYEHVKELEKNFDKIEYVHVLRNQNKRADSLSNKAIDKYIEISCK